MLRTIWGCEVLRVLSILEFTQGVSNPCLYFYNKRQLRVEIHGDDFVVLGRRTDLVWLDTSLKEYWDTKSEIFGPPGETQCVHQARILGRLVTWKRSGIELEADPRLAELVVKSLGILNANGKVGDYS